MRLDGECEHDGKIIRAVAVVRHAKGQRARPTPQIPVNRIELILQLAVHGVEIVLRAKAPIVVHP